MTLPKRIFIAESVPLDNKGEEAIIRGIKDVVFPDEEVDIGVLDFVESPVKRGDIHIFPFEWLYPNLLPMRVEGVFPKLSFKRKLDKYTNAFLALFHYPGPTGYLLKAVPDDPRTELIQFIKNSDIVFFGHDGAWGIHSPSVLINVKKMKKRTGIFGCGTAIPENHLLKFYSRIMYRRAIEFADFSFFREYRTYRYFRECTAGHPKVKLTPDPAFGMRPLSRRQIGSAGLILKDLKKRGRVIVACTVCENSVVFTKAFPTIREPRQKQEIHRRALKTVFDRLIEKNDAVLLFIPHSIHKSTGDDIALSQTVRALMANKRDAVVLEDDLGARELKSIIAECDFLVGERAHSIIAAISSATPFAVLTNEQDTRIHDIVGRMADCSSVIFDINDDPVAIAEGITCLINERERLVRKLKGISLRLANQLNSIKDEIRSPIND